MKKLFIMLLIVTLGAVSCKKETCENPFYCDWDTPFGVPPFDKIKFEHFKPAYLKGMEDEMAEVSAIIENSEEPTFDNTIRAMQFTGELLSKVQRAMGPLSGANGALPEPTPMIPYRPCRERCRLSSQNTGMILH